MPGSNRSAPTGYTPSYPALTSIAFIPYYHFSRRMLYEYPRARLIGTAISIIVTLALLFYSPVLGFSGNYRFMATLESRA